MHLFCHVSLVVLDKLYYSCSHFVPLCSYVLTILFNFVSILLSEKVKQAAPSNKWS